MKSFLILLFFAFFSGLSFSRVHAAAIVADHNAVSAYSSLTDDQISAAAAKKVVVRRASVGGNISDGLDALGRDRSNWDFSYRGNPGWLAKVNDLGNAECTDDSCGSPLSSGYVQNHLNEFDVFSMKFCWIDAPPNANTTFNTYRDMMVNLENSYPAKKFIWFTMPLYVDGIWDGNRFDVFNNLVRSYVNANNKILFDLAAIESHTSTGTLHTVNGYEALVDSYTDDGGHLNSTGAARAAKAWWWLMAQVAGGGSLPTTTLTPTSYPHCTPLGDVDCSGRVTVIDLSKLLAKFNTNDAASDLDDSGVVNVFDLSKLLMNYGRTGSTPTPILTPTPPQTSGFTNFITRTGKKLYDGTKEFRFLSFNAGNLVFQEWPKPNWRLSTEYEMEDILKTIKDLGGQVMRTYVLAVKRNVPEEAGFVAHYLGPGNYSEEAFVNLDKALNYANKHGVRIILPIIDRYDFIGWGGIKDFAAFRNKNVLQFFTDSAVKQDFKNYLNFILNRVNTVSGVTYKNDKAVMAWELGNELYNTTWDSDNATLNDSAVNAWVKEMATYIKSIDANHLVMFPGYDRALTTATPGSDFNVDVVDVHYTADYLSDYTSLDVPAILGEYESTRLANDTLVHQIINTSGITGALAWALMSHRREGGFYYTYYWDDPCPLFRYPGFVQNNSQCSVLNEPDRIARLRNHAYEIQGLSVPVMAVPEAPTLLPISSQAAISWQGSVGASSYDVRRATSAFGPWTVIKSGFSDASWPEYTPYSDTTAATGQTYYYSIIAKNSSGSSPISNIVSVVAN